MFHLKSLEGSDVMLIPTMTDQEKRAQVIQDSKELGAYISSELRPKIIKAARKFNNFPRIFKSERVTRNRNKYHIRIKVLSRSDVNHAHMMSAYTIMDANEGKYALAISTRQCGEDFVQIYVPHLFTRYSQRYGCDMFEEERIHRFMEDSLSPECSGVRLMGDGTVFATVLGGVLLGVEDNGVVVYKTYVDEARLREEQLDEDSDLRDSFMKKIAKSKRWLSVILNQQRGKGEAK